MIDLANTVPGRIVQYHGSLRELHGEYVLARRSLRDAHTIVLVAEQNPDTRHAIRCRPESATATERQLRLCSHCRHDAARHVPENPRWCEVDACTCRQHGAIVFERF